MLSLVDGFFEALSTLQNFLSPLQDDQTDRCGRHGLLAALENLCAQFFFQLLYHRAERRLRHATRIGGLGKLTVARKGDNILQLLQGHSKELWFANIQSLSLTARSLDGFLQIGFCKD